MRTLGISLAGGLILVMLGALPFFARAQGQAQNQQGGVAQPAAAGNIENGKKLYNTVGCWQCHGYSGQGGAGPKVAPDPLPLPAFTRYIRKPTGQMPPYSEKVLKDSELADIHTFLKTIPKPPDPKDIPLLSAEESAAPDSSPQR